jgi:aldehyde:ferredoxin oxidoreductase
MKEYYQLRAWDSGTGWPTKEKLVELSLEKEMKILYKD